MDFYPFSFLLLLNLNFSRLQPSQILHLLDERLERSFAAVVKDSSYNCLRNVKELPPPHSHYYQHDQIEKSQLENNEEYIRQANKQ